jgi:hypothetical protein
MNPRSSFISYSVNYEELDGPTVSTLRRSIAEVKQQCWSLDDWSKMYYLEHLRASEGTLSCWFRMY